MGDLIRYFLRLGALGFGGPIALAGYMQRDLVEERRWFAEADYKEGLALSQLSPGPLAGQLAMYLGWVRGGALGALFVGVAFVLPSFLMVVILAGLYVRYGGLAWMQGAFYGIGAGVIAIIARSAAKLAKMTLAKDALLWALFAITGVVTAITESEIAWLFPVSGFIAMMVKAPPRIGRAAAPLALPVLERNCATARGCHATEGVKKADQLGWRRAPHLVQPTSSARGPRCEGLGPW